MRIKWIILQKSITILKSYVLKNRPLKYTKQELKEMKVTVKSLSRVRLFATPWTVAYQAPPTMGFSRQEYWNGLSFPSPNKKK